MKMATSASGDDKKKLVKVGPYGARACGQPWDDRDKDGIAQIFICYGESVINSLRFNYVKKNGKLELSDRYGGDCGLNFTTVDVDYPSEFLTWVRGSYNAKSGLVSLTFGTNISQYGPFGGRESMRDSYVVVNGRNKGDSEDSEFYIGMGKQLGGFAGFHGYFLDDNRILSIGAYIKPATGNCGLPKN
ncbi:PREDICTED: inactive protein RESTRICTED TEV MOVEMENT 1-like [Nelumbo nucifera]|uniref:Inactive protein RESTRICTED TEV MOVEMENT 1-like n=2 Tax=Nelumbo nucifera TaxID=4432 RepID=A0A1U8B6N6_NELNU|nr:PREDICTED: inactive protein RESTRICTED TEV MOVEMENT 1-like [Nelumbo nucifera]DAD42916.1 TPA_asm: hypothetical protein HUJ06_001146 [Nelumbo nucifera]